MTQPAPSLEALLAAVRAKQGAAKAAKAASKRPAIFTAAAEAEHRWAEVCVPQHYLARYWRATCSHCGDVELGLEGIYEVRKHPRLSDQVTRRLTAISPESLNPQLPRLCSVVQQQLAACPNCVEDFGFNPHEAADISTTQEQPNATPEEPDTEDQDPSGADADPVCEGDDLDSLPSVSEGFPAGGLLGLDGTGPELLHPAP